ncbi:MAG: asparagine synthase (glutamine-hydrolyzing) [Ruminococcus sp.]|nr:asparagine synthase (glutamine-hydrolyzing) [Ruminococcus sp.]
MCGICGFTGEVLDRSKTIRKMADVITHRGPDSSGFYEDSRISMGFRRLSIIDVDAGHQPIYNEDKTLVLTFNGEIYNYRDLREELVAAGHTFYTETDSEVLVHGFEQWGEDMLHKLRGMFGFAIYNTQDGSVFIARDFFGIKPMHYTVIDGELVYGSEIKSILQHPKYKKSFNMSALDNYLSFQYVVPPETFFEGIYCLLPGHFLWFKNGEVMTERYFEARFDPNENMSEADAVNSIEAAFENSVNAHKIADVEVGCFLSSGVDSSYVSTYFADQKTFTVGFDFGEKYNEISWAQRLSEKIGVDHHTKVITSEEYWDSIPKIQYFMDQPLADPSCIALYFVSQLASKYVKVVLSGEGADELFGGYQVYRSPMNQRVYQKCVPYPIRKLLRSIARKLPDIKGRDYLIRACDPLEEAFIGNAFMYNYEEKCELLKDPSIATRPQDLTRDYYRRARRYDDVTKMQYLDINLWMVGDILLKADRMSMANSLELRVPFLDKEVWKVASRIPSRLRVNRNNTKYALRQAALRHLPQETAEKEKLGFPVPTRVWLRDEKYYNVVKQEFQSPTAQKFFNIDILLRWLDDHFSGVADTSRNVWTVYVFLVWYKQYFEEISAEEIKEEAIAEVEAIAQDPDAQVAQSSLNIPDSQRLDQLFGLAFDDEDGAGTEEVVAKAEEASAETPAEDASSEQNQ